MQLRATRAHRTFCALVTAWAPLGASVHSLCSQCPGLRQTALRDHAADVLYELPDSRVGSHFLQNAWMAMRSVCDEKLPSNSAPGITWEKSRGLDKKR